MISGIKFQMIILLFAFHNSQTFAQSKKEQIENLKLRTDSLSNLLFNERNLHAIEIREANSLIQITKNHIDSLSNVINFIISNYNQSELENSKLENRIKVKVIEFDDLKNQLENKSDSLNFISEELKRINESNQILKDSINKNGYKLFQEQLKSILTVKIGKQEWMVNDINTTVYNNGDPINQAKNENQWIDYGNKNLGCYFELINGTYLYNGYAVNDLRGIIPIGFILPTYDQFNQLIEFLGGGDSQSGKATKSMANYPIYIENWVGDERTGGLEEVEIKTNGNSKFNAKNGGFVYVFDDNESATIDEGNCSYWWTASSEGNKNIVLDIGYCSQFAGGGKGSYPKISGFAVRALKK
jgi:uncharacterized protein (TIGR02145 family)